MRFIKLLTPSASVDFFCLLGRDQQIEMKLGCENIMSQNTIVQRIELIERLTFLAPIAIFPCFWKIFCFQ